MRLRSVQRGTVDDLVLTSQPDHAVIRGSIRLRSALLGAFIAAYHVPQPRVDEHAKWLASTLVVVPFPSLV
jgi:hypothetical protein